MDQGFNFDCSLILDSADGWGYAREPVLAVMPDGSLLCTLLSGGPLEPDNRNVTLAVRSFDAGRTWTEPKVLFYHRSRAAYTTELFTGGTLPLLFVQTYAAESRYREICTFMSVTRDSGRTWSEPVSVPGPSAHVNTRHGIILSNGDWLFPVYWQQTDRKWDWEQIPVGNDIHMDWPSCCGAMISADGGNSFHTYGDLKAQFPLMENACVEVEEGHVVMLMRAEKCEFLYRSDSYDYGRTWSEAAVCKIPSASSKIVLEKYEDKILLVHNDVKGNQMTQRKNLSIWVSRDGMETWVRKIPLTGEDTVMFYPHIAADQSGMIYLACENSRQSYCLRIHLDQLFEEGQDGRMA